MSIISKDITKAVNILTEEDIVAIPTETVYGLAGNIFSEKAIRKIFEVKERPLFNPLIVHIHSIEQLKELVSEFPEKAQQLATIFWPGPLTLILKKNACVPGLVTGGKDTVAVRIPNHPVALRLLKELSFPLAAPSANPFNRISPTSAIHVEDYFKNKLSMILEGGECSSGIESTIIGFENEKPVLYRLGSISIEEINAVIGEVLIQTTSTKTPAAPGMLAKHYAPQTKTFLVDDAEEILKEQKGKRIGVLRFTEKMTSTSCEYIEVLSKTADLKEAASNLYSALHKLDHLNLDIIVVESFPNVGLGKTINDRLERAAT